MLFLLSALLMRLTLAQDPASGWMAYAVGAIPSTYQRITFLQMEWQVSQDAKPSRAFYSPWFGMDPADNLNLIQPVNPWGGSSWSMYTEYYQWQPTHNSNSRSYAVKAGQVLNGTLEYDAGNDSYELYQHILGTNTISQQNVPCQNGKKYVIPYIVYEKTWPCADYPPDEEVNFKIIRAECDGVDCINQISWKAAVKDPNCDMKAVIYNQTSISITWNTKAKSRFDGLSRAELDKLNGRDGWGREFLEQRRGASKAVQAD